MTREMNFRGMNYSRISEPGEGNSQVVLITRAGVACDASPLYVFGCIGFGETTEGSA